MGETFGEEGQSQKDEGDVRAPKYGVEDHGFTLLGVIPRPSSEAYSLPLDKGRVVRERFFNALVLKGVFQKAKECLRGEISGYDCSRRLNLGA